MGNSTSNDHGKSDSAKHGEQDQSQVRPQEQSKTSNNSVASNQPDNKTSQQNAHGGKSGRSGDQDR